MAAPADPKPEQKPMVHQPPPVGRTWPRVYAFVLGVLAVSIVLLYALTRGLS